MMAVLAEGGQDRVAATFQPQIGFPPRSGSGSCVLHFSSASCRTSQFAYRIEGFRRCLAPAIQDGGMSPSIDPRSKPAPIQETRPWLGVSAGTNSPPTRT